MKQDDGDDGLPWRTIVYFYVKEQVLVESQTAMPSKQARRAKQKTIAVSISKRASRTHDSAKDSVMDRFVPFFAFVCADEVGEEWTFFYVVFEKFSSFFNRIMLRWWFRYIASDVTQIRQYSNTCRRCDVDQSVYVRPD